jgi:hypothetical protein
MSYFGSITFDGNKDKEQDSQYVYYNASIINNKTKAPYDRTADPIVRFTEIRDTPIVRDASKYLMSIVRFSLNGPNKDLCILIPVIRQGLIDNPTQDVNLTIYSITIDAVVDIGGNPTQFSSQQILKYVPETLDTSIAPVPPASTVLTGQDLSTRYYWVYSYSHWLTIVNKAFTDAITDLSSQITTAGGSPLVTTAPIMTYNPTNNLFTIYCDRRGFGGNDASTSERLTLYFNSNMTGLFDNFRNEYVANTLAIPANKNWTVDERINRIYTGVVGPYQNILSVSTGTPTPTTAIDYWLIVQDYESTSTLWSPIESIVFTSSLLPIVFESSSDPIRFSDSNTDSQTTGSRPVFQNIITDVQLVNQNAHDYRQYIQYAPVAEYRLSNFQNSKVPINQIDIQVSWKNRLDGKLYPITMFNCSSVSIKMMLKRKDD